MHVVEKKYHIFVTNNDAVSETVLKYRKKPPLKSN